MAGVTRSFMEIESEADDVLQTLRSLMITLSPAGLTIWSHTALKEFIQERTETQFETEGHGEWAPLRATTQEIRRDLGYGESGPINVRTAELRKFATDSDIASFPYGNMGLLAMYPAEDPVGELRKKLRTAQVGTYKTVARPVFTFGAPDAVAIMMILSAFIQAAVPEVSQLAGGQGNAG